MSQGQHQPRRSHRQPDRRPRAAHPAQRHRRLQATVACNTRRKDAASGEYVDKPNYFDVTVWGAHGENAAKFLSKGRALAVDGRLEWREWETDTTGKRQAVEIIADTIQFLGAPNGSDDAS